MFFKVLRIIFSIFNIGKRGRDEARKLKWGDISVDQGNAGKYLEFRERTTNTEPESVPTRVPSFQKRMKIKGSLLDARSDYFSCSQKSAHPQ